MLTDVAYNWRKAKLAHRMSLPAVAVLQSGSIRSKQTSVFLEWGHWGDDVTVVRDWIAENIADSRVFGMLFARIEWHPHRFRTSKKLIGLTFEFSNICDLMLFRLRW